MLRTTSFEARASGRHLRIAPRKVRKVADMIRKQKVTTAIELLTFTKVRGARVLKKILTSAIASAREKNLGDVDTLVVSKVMVDKGPVSKRWLPRAMGRATRINKFSCHVHLFVAPAGK